LDASQVATRWQGLVAGPVDRCQPGLGLRLRHVPGEVGLRTRQVSAGEVSPGGALTEDIRDCLAGNPAALTITRSRPDPTRPDLPCVVCGAAAPAASIDVAVGPNAGLVVESVPGHWCWPCRNAQLADVAGTLLPRLGAFDPRAPGTELPSLVYDTPAHPRSVQFEITTHCNLACSYCSHRQLPSHRHQTADRFERWLDRIDLALVDNVDFTGLGEPLLNRDLPAMVAAVRRRGQPTHVRVVTNGTVLTPRVFEPLCQAGLTSIAVSIDSLDPQRFARNRDGARLEAVLANVSALVEYRRSAGLDSLAVKVKAVLTEDVFAEAERLLVYSARMGLAAPDFSCLDSRERAAPFYDEPWLRLEGAGEQYRELPAWADARWHELTGAPPASADAAEPTPAERAAGFLNPSLAPPGVCRWAVDATFVTLEGGSLSCCETMIDVPRDVLGSLDGASMAELWTGELLWRYRLPLSLGWLPPGCAGCSWAPSAGQPLPTAQEGDGRST
jgi:hypothetical protein